MAGEDRAGDHRADAGQREAAIDGQTEAAGCGTWRQGGGGGQQPRLQLGDAGPGHRRDRHDLGICEARSRQQDAHLLRYFGQPLGSDEIGLGECDDAVLQAEEIEDLQMLARLRHRPVVGGDDQQDEIDADGAGEHVVHEALMAGHVDEAQGLAALDRPIGEADVDGDAARLLFGQTVGVDSRERPHQRRLPVIDVAGRADDHGGPSDLKRLCAAALSSAVMTASTRRRNPAASSFPRPAASVSQRKACA